MGHMGTLDPNATGLLPICLGRATRLSRYLLKADKRYFATVKLGQATTTYDADGEPDGEPAEPPSLSPAELEKILDAYRGKFLQRPPIYSAKKLDGKRLYQLAREGKNIEPEKCEVAIHELHLVKQNRESLELDILSSTGMYVRSLAHDIGQDIGCGAYLEKLQRRAVGPLSIEDAQTLERVAEMEEAGDRSFLRPMADLLPDFPPLEINAGQAERIRSGGPIVTLDPSYDSGVMVRLVDARGQLVAVGLTKKPLGSMQMQVHPKVVLI
jgi:tRNA pseudouridine55 synthase